MDSKKLLEALGLAVITIMVFGASIAFGICIFWLADNVSPWFHAITVIVLIAALTIIFYEVVTKKSKK